ncbi:hypothetical protein PflQ2_3222 [Pseudomonas fluorescens Q2-87]|uniref:Uncharacterized protein n=1 Tax=Pseudomonas fluorescens (strain Q2-87) TaxID=1038922 RepID=J2Y324_PSEFQ|nr:hypothetical protein PflQ2_3222 [Pseudomonas fluorescens Q2-87]
MADGCSRAFFSIGRMSDMWIAQEKLPLGEHIARHVEWLTEHGAGIFNAISLLLSGVITAFTSALLWLNPLALIAIFALLAYYIGDHHARRPADSLRNGPSPDRTGRGRYRSGHIGRR